jgi:hypothetical protein
MCISHLYVYRLSFLFIYFKGICFTGGTYFCLNNNRIIKTPDFQFCEISLTTWQIDVNFLPVL